MGLRGVHKHLSRIARKKSVSPRILVDKRAYKRSISKRERRAVWENKCGKRYLGVCSVQWCKTQLCALDSWHVAHIQPESKGGSNMLHNLVPTCAQCNLSMGTTSLVEYNLRFKSPNGFLSDLWMLRWIS